MYKYFPLILLFIACSNPKPEKIKNINSIEFRDYDSIVAIKFMNGYVEACNKRKDEIQWVKQNKYITPEFKSSYTKIINDGWKADPEMGLGFDPIFDAQDYPEEGFYVESIDKKTGKVVLKGKVWKDFFSVVQLKRKGRTSRVNGVGIIHPKPVEAVKISTH